MRIEFGRRCSMMKEAMSLLEFAVNVDETERRRYLSKLGRFGEEKEPGIRSARNITPPFQCPVCPHLS